MNGVSQPNKNMENLNIVLVHPEIPPNTGNIARLCGATNSYLHLVHPLGFKTDDRHLKRAGLDYWDKVKIFHHSSIEEFINSVPEERLLLFSARARFVYTSIRFEPGQYLLFGSETKGLPEHILTLYKSRCFYIPIWGGVRSLNLSTAVGIVAYEAYRQIGFGDHWRECIL